MTNTEKLKKHLKKHKVAYTVGGTAIGVAGLTYVIVRWKYADVKIVSENSTEFNIRPFSFFARSVDQSSKIVNVIEREGRGHPGYIVRCLETGKLFASQAEAAKEYGAAAASLSSHIRGTFPDFCGHHFERIGILG